MSADETVETTILINGVKRTLRVAPEASAVEVLRDELHLTGTKIVCGAGVCGACTVLVDGQPTTSCLATACSLDGKAVTTVERFAGERLHPVQRAFMAHDGLQCGYCTPGFIVESIAFYDRWRAARGKSTPPRETIALALCGHLCRCGAYVGIYEAVRAACAGDFDDPSAALSYPRHEALEKVTGAARYTTDVHYDGLLTAKLLGSPHAHARVVSVDVSAALAMDGVHAAIDVLDDIHRVVRYAGHPIVAVAARDERTAREAIEAVRVEYEVRPFVVDPERALEPDAPVVYPESKRQPPNASEGPIPPGTWSGNLRKPHLNKMLSHHAHKAERAVKKAREGRDGLWLVEDVYVSPAQTHTALEPHGCVARWDDESGLHVHASTQNVHLLGKEIQRHYHLRSDQVHVYSEHIGGAFGAKQGMRLEHTAAIDLAREAKAPVKLTYDRLEEMTLGGYRPRTRIHLAIASDGEGQRGLTMQAYGACGIAVQAQHAPWFRMTYDGPKHVEDFDVTTHWSPAKPMRGPCGPSAFWALEQAVDQMAHDLEVDPIALRRRWDPSDVRDGLYDWAEALPAWRDRGAHARDRGRFRRGVGLAMGNWFTVFHNATRVQIDARPEGILASCAVQDMGNGARSVIAKAVAEELGLDFHTIGVAIGHSSYVEGPVSSASRTTASVYPTAVEAAQILKAELVKRATKALGLEGARYENAGITHAGGHVPLGELMQRIPAFFVRSKKHGGNTALDLMGMMPSGDLGMSVYPRMTGALAVVSVDVDTRLGRVLPRKVWYGMSSGKIVNPALARSQIYGAMIQSLGFALTEERNYDPHRGALLSLGLEEYRIPGIGDVPEVEVFFDETRFPKLKGGAAGLSELASLPVAPALANAVFHATGWRPTEAPLTPERVLDNVG